MKRVSCVEDIRLRWLAHFANLRVDVDRRRGKAPHKALLLLSVLDQIEAGELEGGRVRRFDPRLVFRFQTYWSIVVGRCGNKGDIRLPFHALGTHQEVWAHRLDAEGRASKARETTEVAILPEELGDLFADPSFRDDVRRVLVTTYFPPPEQAAFMGMLKLDDPRLASRLRDEVATYQAAIQQGRSQRFKTDVVIGYQLTCALTGYRLTTAKGKNIVVAAHIHAFARSRNDDPRNGLALTPNAHWAFDEGLWTAVPEGRDRFRVRVARQAFSESAVGGMALGALDGGLLHFAVGVSLRPDPKHFAWHREHVFAQ
ncbi:MAG: HNH endonuclease [Verrucomicrobiae bacterium]|nr:HNH endonuclease [Verrucomicrobiae bacterium]